MITISDLTFAYGNHSVFKGLSQSFEQGKVHGILGVNGVGKSTFFRLLGGRLKKAKGEVLMGERQLGKKNTFLLETQNYFYPNITGEEYLSLFTESGNGFSQSLMNDLFHLPLQDMVDSYSTGMKKKLAIMAMLKGEEGVLLMDEPFNGLDLESSRVLVHILDKLRKKGRTVLISSHILETLTGSCDEIHILEKGIFERTVKKDAFDLLEKEFFQELDQKISARLGS